MISPHCTIYYFAGLVLLITGVIQAGDEVRFLTGSLPYQPANLPAYKYFSPDYINVGYRGSIIEVDHFIRRW